MAKQRQQDDDDEYTSALETAIKSQGFERTSLILPEGATMFQPKRAGIFRFDIIPYRCTVTTKIGVKGKLHYERQYYTHKKIGPNNSSYVCPRANFDKKCPICEHKSLLASDPDPEQQKAAKAMTLSKRQLFNVIDLSEPRRAFRFGIRRTSCLVNSLTPRSRALMRMKPWPSPTSIVPLRG